MEPKELNSILLFLANAIKDNDFGDDNTKIKDLYNELKNMQNVLPSEEELDKLQKIEIDLESGFERELAEMIIEKYKDYYQELTDNKQVVLDVLTNELNKFNRTLEKGLREDEQAAQRGDRAHRWDKRSCRLYAERPVHRRHGKKQAGACVR